MTLANLATSSEFFEGVADVLGGDLMLARELDHLVFDRTVEFAQGVADGLLSGPPASAGGAILGALGDPRPPAFITGSENADPMDIDRLRPPRWLRWVGVALVAGVIFYSSVLDPPSSGLPALGPLGLLGIDKWLHALAYAALAAALASALAADRPPATAAVLAAALAVAYGVGIEFVQAPLPERSFSVADMVADGVGAAVAVLCWRGAVGVVRRFESASTSKTEHAAERDA